jgi:N-acetylglutamate synthase-like GNAT family acetyltransferase
MIQIRPAKVADAKALAELRWEFRSAQDPPVESHDAFVRRGAAWMRRELRTGSSWQAWIAFHDDVIVGQVWLHTIQKIPNPAVEHERLAYLSNLYVAMPARGGTGSRLLEAALDSCRANDIDRVVLWPSKRSVTLYSSHGFSRDGGVMELKL